MENIKFGEEILKTMDAIYNRRSDRIKNREIVAKGESNESGVLDGLFTSSTGSYTSFNK